MICADVGCQCAITSDSLTISGSGGQGDPYQIDTNAFSIVTSLTRPGTPFTNQFIYETDTRRIRVWDGTYWRIVGGDMPGFQIERQSSLSIPDITESTVGLPTEIYDTDAFHAASDGFVTIPAGFGGDYLIIGFGQWTANAVGLRYVRPLIGSNPTPPAQNNGSRSGGYAVVNSTLNGYFASEIFQLEAGATITLRAYQSSGGALDLVTGSLKGLMIRHLPQLT